MFCDTHFSITHLFLYLGGIALSKPKSAQSKSEQTSKFSWGLKAHFVIDFLANQRIA